MPYNHYSPIPGRLGSAPGIFQSGRINTGTLAPGTQTHSLGGYNRRGWIKNAVLSAGGYPTAATSCVATLVKYNTTDGAVTLTDDLVINTQTADTVLNFVFPSTLTEKQRTLNPGDVLRLVIVTVGAVTVQPDDITVTIDLFVEN